MGRRGRRRPSLEDCGGPGCKRNTTKLHEIIVRTKYARIMSSMRVNLRPHHQGAPRHCGSLQLNLEMAPSIWKKNAAVAYPIGLIRGLSLFCKYRGRTMVPGRIYAENLALLAMTLRNPDLNRGAVVECGTWRGGMSAGMVEMAGLHRKYHFFDSFEGLPPAGERDGEQAKEYMSAPIHYDYGDCRASLEDFKQTIAMTGCPEENIGIHKGFFEDTLPHFSSPPIAILRLDADWYVSTMICLEKFWDHVLPGGLILIDDYNVWEGCSKAVHAFFAKREVTEHLRQGPIGRVAFIIKKS